MISFFTGKPGGGKGLLSMQQIVDELVSGKRHIICNTPVRLLPWIFGNGQPMIGLKSYLLQKYGKDFDCEKRVHILDDDDISSFFLFRVVDGKLQKAEADIQKKGDEERVMGYDTSLAAQSGGVLYVVDEAWKFYGSRNWQKTGEAMLFYAAQHRHFGDDVLIVTQHTKQIDPAIQRVAQDFWVVTNHSKLSFGMFRQPDIFSVAIFDQAPTGGQLKPMSRKIFRLDKKGLAQTYDTSSGVGLAGRMAADTGARKKGLPWWTFLILAAIIIAVVSEIPRLGGWVVGKALPKLAQKPPAQNQPARPHRSLSDDIERATEDGVTDNADRSDAPKNQVRQRPLGDSPEDTNNVTCSGIAILSKDNVIAFFSDGSTAYGSEGEIQKISGHWVYAFGKKYRLCGSPARSQSSRPRDDYAQSDHIVDYGQNNLPDAPVNDAEILPSISSQASAIVSPPRINGIGSMSFSQSVSHAQSQGYQSSN